MTEEYKNFIDEILLSLGISMELIVLLPYPKCDNVYLATKWLNTDEIYRLSNSAIVYYIKNMNKSKIRKSMNKDILHHIQSQKGGHNE